MDLLSPEPVSPIRRGPKRHCPSEFQKFYRSFHLHGVQTGTLLNSEFWNARFRTEYQAEAQ